MRTYHRYLGFNHFLRRLIAVILLLGGLPIFILTFIGGTIGLFTSLQKSDPLFFLLFGLFGIIGFVIIGLGNLYLFPNVTISREGMQIPFLFHKIFIAWPDVIGVESIWFSRKSVQIVKCREITPFHRLYGLVYTGSLTYPSFLISPQIEDFHKLMREIKSRFEQNNSNMI